MAFGARARMVNPRLGTYFSIFAALFTALFLLILIFEQLRLDEHLLKLVFFAGPIVIYAAIGLSVASNDTLNYFASGRRVPALYTGVLLATCSLGGTFLVAGTGAFFFAGFDALVLMLGTLTGFVVMAIVLAPFYRKFGAFTVPSYLGRRFESRPLRIITAVVAAVPMLLVLSAELRMGAGVAGRLITASPNMIVALLALSVAVSTASGGMRSFTWVGVAQSIAVFLAFARRRNDRQRDRHELANPAARQWADGALARSQRGARGPAGRQCLAVGVPIAGRRVRSADEALHAAFRYDRPIGVRAWHICDRDRN